MLSSGLCGDGVGETEGETVKAEKEPETCSLRQRGRNKNGRSNERTCSKMADSNGEVNRHVTTLYVFVLCG